MQLPRLAEWFASRYDGWRDTRFGIYEMGRVGEVENAIGRLAFRDFMDCPPYAQLLLQGLNEPALRHPEYHLGSDLALLFNLFLDNEAILAEAAKRRELHSSEHSQSLGRSVILTCFNLLEAFVSGLAVAWLMENPSASAEIVKRLEDKNLPLRRRLIELPGVIVGRPGVIDGKKPPMEPLLGECKRRRDSFVHCEPGSKPTSWGYVKEHEFHSVDAFAVRKTLELTLESISLVWKVVHGRERPSWLPQLNTAGRFERITVVLTPVSNKLPVRNAPTLAT